MRYQKGAWRRTANSMGLSSNGRLVHAYLRHGGQKCVTNCFLTPVFTLGVSLICGQGRRADGRWRSQVVCHQDIRTTRNLNPSQSIRYHVWNSLFSSSIRSLPPQSPVVVPSMISHDLEFDVSASLSDYTGTGTGPISSRCRHTPLSDFNDSIHWPCHV